MPRKILFVVAPGIGHLFPVVPLAWACRAAGHDILVATAGVALHAGARAGLHVVDVAPGIDFGQLQQRHKADFAAAAPPSGVAGETTPAVFAAFCDATASGVMDAALRWKPDLVVYTPEAMPGLMAATRLQVPAVFFGVGLAHTPALMAERYANLAALCARHDVSALAEPAAWLDVRPPSLAPAAHGRGWAMRYVQYNGGEVIREPGERADEQTIAVTLGTITPFVTGLQPLRAIIDIAPQLNASFVIAYGTGNAKELGSLPKNVRVRNWIGLDYLAATCDAAIHHGGFGTTLGFLVSGRPQLLMPQGADQFYNARAIEQRGAGFVCDGLLTVDAIHRLLSDARLRGAADDIRCEIADMPPPGELVNRLASLA